MKGLSRRRPATTDPAPYPPEASPDPRSSNAPVQPYETGAARARVVNRTHRVVRDQALRMQEQRKVSRSLWAPLAICSTLLLVICYATWGLLVEYDITPSSIPDASDQMLFLLLLWSLPVAAVALGLIWFRRHRGAHDNVRGPVA